MNRHARDRSRKQNQKTNLMKPTSIKSLIITASLIVSISFFAGYPNVLRGADTSTAKGGGTKLIELNAAKSSVATFTAAAKTMNCVSCKETTLAVRSTETKGGGGSALLSGGAPKKNIARHLCSACETGWVVKGVGKTALNVPDHKCGSCN
jgi:hypothetical protein